VAALLLAAHLSKVYPHLTVVENKPGAATILAAQAVATAPPDGLTLCFCVTNVATNKFSYKTLPYKLEDLAPVAIGFKSTTVTKLLLYPVRSTMPS
jgi:tripartite-type tricarboxylate transporter receptor subunit TctC